MKNTAKMFGFIALIAVIGFFMAGCGLFNEVENVSKFHLWVEGGTGGGDYEKGTTVNITATVPSGKQFEEWTVYSMSNQNLNNVLANKNSPNTTVTMPDASITVTAHFKEGPNTSLNGDWGYNEEVITINGSTGVYKSITFSDKTWLSAKDKGFVKVGDQRLKNLTSTGNLTWSGQMLIVNFNESSPDTATGVNWSDVTIKMSTNGQTITCYVPNTVDVLVSYTRK